MTPKDTAEYLIKKYSIIPINMGFSYEDTINLRKECALITVCEILGEYEIEHDAPKFLYWEKVKKEIEKL